MASAPHGPAPGIHHEADEEAVGEKGHGYVWAVDVFLTLVILNALIYCVLKIPI